MTNTIRRFFSREHGRTVVHCAVVLELIAIIYLVAISSINTKANASTHGTPITARK
jgi:Flp pilus assembly pilin Flp